MTRMTMIAAALAAAPLVLPGVAAAANAQHPYSNVDHRVDAGNDTGDARVDALNQQQLDRGGAPGAVGRVAPRPGYATVYGAYPPPVYVRPAYVPPIYAAPAYYPPLVVVSPYPYYRAYRYPYRYYPY